jgi:putative peptidoglycan lipid II flippase
MEELRATLRRSLRMLAFLCIPASVGLALLGTPVVRLIYERGAFSPEDTRATAAALACYALALVAYTGVKVLAPAFYALGTPRIPLLGSCLAVLTNLVAILLLHPVLGFKGVALGTSLGSLVNVAVLVAAFERRAGGLRGHGLASGAGQMTAAAAIMGALCLLSLRGLEAGFGTHGLFAQLVTGLGPVLVGVVCYAGVARALGIPEINAILALLRRRR